MGCIRHDLWWVIVVASGVAEDTFHHEFAEVTVESALGLLIDV